MKIYAPVKDANGVYASVRFINGVGETDNPHLIDWFRKHGYRVPIEEPTPVNFVIEPKNDEVEPDFEAMTPNELREWCKANGLGGKIKNIRNKEKLLELIRG